MRNCQIDTTAAQSFAHDLWDGANRFCRAHPQEIWRISGVYGQTGLALNADDGKRKLITTLSPVINMADSIFETLEEFRNTD